MKAKILDLNKIVKLFVQIYFLLLLTKATKITIGWSGLVSNCLFSRLFLLETLGSPIIVITTTTIIKIIRQLGFLSAESIAKSVELADPPYQPPTNPSSIEINLIIKTQKEDE